MDEKTDSRNHKGHQDGEGIHLISDNRPKAPRNNPIEDLHLMMATCRGKPQEVKEEEEGNEESQTNSRTTDPANQPPIYPPAHQAVDDKPNGWKKGN